MSDEEDYSQFDVQIGNKEYRMIAGRVQECRDEHAKADKPYEFHTDLIPLDGQILFKATVKTLRGEATGHAGAYDKTMIDKTAPYENAETSAVGRALGFLGYGLVTGIASAEEVTEAKKRSTTTSNKPTAKATDKQVNYIHALAADLQYSDQDKEDLKARYKVESTKSLTAAQASEIIGELKREVESRVREEKPPEGVIEDVFEGSELM